MSLRCIQLTYRNNEWEVSFQKYEESYDGFIDVLEPAGCPNSAWLYYFPNKTTDKEAESILFEYIEKCLQQEHEQLLTCMSKLKILQGK